MGEGSYCVNPTLYLEGGKNILIQENSSLGLYSSTVCLGGGGILLDGFFLTLGDGNISIDRILRSFLANYTYDSNGNLVSDSVLCVYFFLGWFIYLKVVI